MSDAPTAARPVQSREQAISLYRHLYRRKIRLFKRLYEFTISQCGSCVEGGCACHDKICEHVEEQAAKRGHRFPHTGHRLRFIGPQGCLIPPHLRETCTIYLCAAAQNRPGFDRDQYDRIRQICARVEWKLMELEEAWGPELLRVT